MYGMPLGICRFCRTFTPAVVRVAPNKAACAVHVRELERITPDPLREALITLTTNGADLL